MNLFFLIKHFNRNAYSVNFEKWNGLRHAIPRPRAASLLIVTALSSTDNTATKLEGTKLFTSIYF